MTIQKGLHFNSKYDELEGFEDWGEFGGRSSRLATRAVTVMARGILVNWKQPLFYFLSHGPMKGALLNQILESCIEKLQDASMHVRAIVFDQASNNRYVTNTRIVDEEHPYFFVRGEKIYVLYDIPHLFKSMRNTLKAHDIWTGPGQKASWKHIVAAYFKTCRKGFSLLPKITFRHIFPDGFSKMSVKLAVQVLSHGMYAAIKTLVFHKRLPREAMATARLCKELDTLFDCLNSQSVYPKRGKKHRRALSEAAPHVEAQLRRGLRYLSMLKLADGKKSPPCLSGLRMTIRAILGLWEDMQKEGVTHLMTRRLNQDPIEHLFSKIRRLGGHNGTPTASQFR